jgi:hypothetical protein
MADSAAAASPASRSARPGAARKPPSRPGTSIVISFSSTTARVRKFSCTKVPRLAPIWSFFRGMIAVCGIGNRSGCRNSAVTANQSARAPTMEASAVART